MKKIISIFVLTITIAIVFSCKKEAETPTGGNKIEIGQSTTNSLSYFTAKVSTTLTATGGNEISQHGHCWNIEKEPTIENNKTTLGKLTQPKTFTSELTNLTNNTTYYVRSYVTYANGTVYGSEQSIQTLTTRKPIVTTNEVSNITINSVTCGGSNDDGGITVSQRGVCWNTIENPTLQNSIGHTNDSSGTGSFISDIIDLNDGVTYYIAAYATNEKGTSYGEVLSFETLDMTPCDGQYSFNYQGQTYYTVEIEYQCWMQENLNYETGNSWCYNNNSHCDEYGRLYDWETIMNGEASSNTVPSGVQGICPSGWHLPSDEEWKILEGNTDTQYGVGDSEWDGTAYRGYDAGRRLKTITGWYQNPGTNAVDFSARPGGYRYGYGNFYGSGYEGRWWCSTEYSSTAAWHRNLSYSDAKVYRSYMNKESNGFSVRCVRD